MMSGLLFECHGVLDSTNVLYFHPNVITVLQEARQLHEQPNSTWHPSHDQSVPLQSLPLATESNQLLNPEVWLF